MSDNRRDFQRLELAEPFPAELNGQTAEVVDLGVVGARVAYKSALAAGSLVQLVIAADGDSLRFDGVVTRLSDREATSRASYDVGVQFTGSHGEAAEALRRLLARLVREEIARTHLPGIDTGGAGFDLDATAMRIPTPYTSFRFVSGTWSRRGVYIPAQPENGFTVPSTLDREELEEIRRSFEDADETGRNLLRLFAELSVCRVLDIPQRVKARR